MKELARSLVERMPELTVERSAGPALANAEANQPRARRGVNEVPRVAPGTPAIVVSAGPSIHRQDPAGRLGEGRPGPVVVADGALGYLLRNGVVPDYVVSLDPHPTRIVRWFGDPDLEERLHHDDYFRRQDLDPHLGERELERNNDLMGLVDRYGHRITALLSTSVSPNVVDRCEASGMEIYWWNPMLDDPADPESLTRRLHRQNRLPAVVTGGNVGTASWVLAHQVLGADPVLLLGMDFGYPPGTPLTATQYFTDLVALFGEEAPDAFIEVVNERTGETWFSDPTYYWYRDCFLDLARRAGCRTVNCTDGGTLFGDGVELAALDEALAAVTKGN